MRTIRFLTVVLALLSAWMAMPSTSFAERVVSFLFYANGGPDSTSVVIAAPSGSAKSDTASIGGKATRLHPGVYVWDSPKVVPALVDLWVGADASTAQRSAVFKDIMFGRSTVLDQSITSAKFPTLVYADSVFVNKFLGSSQNLEAISTIIDTAAAEVETLLVTEVFVLPDSVSLQIAGSRVYGDSLRVTGDFVYDRAGQTVMPSGICSKAVSVPGARVGDVVLVSVQQHQPANTAARWFQGEVVEDDSILIKRFYFGTNLCTSGDSDTLNYVVLSQEEEP